MGAQVAGVVHQTYRSQAKTVVCAGVEQVGRECGVVAPKIGPHTKRCAACQPIYEAWAERERAAARKGRRHV